MNRKVSESLTDNYLAALEGIKDSEPRAYFYTRLKAKMQARQEASWVLQLKPALLVMALVILLCINGALILQQKDAKRTEATGAVLKSFAADYNLSVSNY